MRLLLIGVCERTPGWVREGVDDYVRRLRPPFSWREIDLPLTKGQPEPARARAEQASRLLAAVPKGALRVVLDERGEALDSRSFARRLAGFQQQASQLAMVVGGPDGLDESVRAGASLVWSLSPLTLPHALVRVLVAEQLYRAQSLLSGHPYHRG